MNLAPVKRGNSCSELDAFNLKSPCIKKDCKPPGVAGMLPQPWFLLIVLHWCSFQKGIYHIIMKVDLRGGHFYVWYLQQQLIMYTMCLCNAAFNWVGKLFIYLASCGGGNLKVCGIDQNWCTLFQNTIHAERPKPISPVCIFRSSQKTKWNNIDLQCHRPPQFWLNHLQWVKRMGQTQEHFLHSFWFSPPFPLHLHLPDLSASCFQRHIISRTQQQLSLMLLA